MADEPEMAELIWASDAKLGSPDDKYWWPNDDTGGVEYIRADLSDAKDARIAELEDRLKAAIKDAQEAEAYAAELEAERDHWKDVAGREGVCMTCRGPQGAPDTYGCTDCLNTGYCGEHHNTVAELEAKLATATNGLRKCEEEIDDYIRQEYPHDHPVQERYRQRDFAANPARTTIAEMKGPEA